VIKKLREKKDKKYVFLHLSLWTKAFMWIIIAIVIHIIMRGIYANNTNDLG
jgi:hypothetical protein